MQNLKFFSWWLPLLSLSLSFSLSATPLCEMALGLTSHSASLGNKGEFDEAVAELEKLLLILPTNQNLYFRNRVLSSSLDLENVSKPIKDQASLKDLLKRAEQIERLNETSNRILRILDDAFNPDIGFRLFDYKSTTLRSKDEIAETLDFLANSRELNDRDFGYFLKRMIAKHLGIIAVLAANQYWHLVPLTSMVLTSIGAGYTFFLLGESFPIFNMLKHSSMGAFLKKIEEFEKLRKINQLKDGSWVYLGTNDAFFDDRPPRVTLDVLFKYVKDSSDPSGFRPMLYVVTGKVML